ncbi:RNA-binding protein [Kitasatospora sp. NPDC088391]|uniref:RNA-binding protein n=1 Tax=Kitasatospora sp. NPDC088391 TaxID=3364074 RepID=UPI00382B2E1B
MPTHVYRVTKYDPADRDGRGHYTGTAEPVSDHGPVEAAYLDAVTAFAEDSGVDELELREPGVAGPVHFGLEPALDGSGLDGLLPGGRAALHDGLRVPLATARELVRAMLRDHGLWCRLEDGDRFTAHVGRDQYLYLGSHAPCERALARTAAAGLFPERIDASPYDHRDEDEPPGPARPADRVFRDRLRHCVESGAVALLEEQYADNDTRWHRLTPATLDAVLAGLAPRARLAARPDPFTALPAATAALRALPADELVELLVDPPDGRITAALAGAAEHLAALAALPVGSRAALLPLALDERRPLLTAVLPDPDGVLRARWRPEPGTDDAHWARLRALPLGDRVAVVAGEDGRTELDGLPAVLRGAALPGSMVVARVAGVDLVREHVLLDPEADSADVLRRGLRPAPGPA